MPDDFAGMIFFIIFVAFNKNRYIHGNITERKGYAGKWKLQSDT